MRNKHLYLKRILFILLLPISAFGMVKERPAIKPIQADQDRDAFY
jgi:hypothetical protein